MHIILNNAFNNINSPLEFLSLFSEVCALEEGKCGQDSGQKHHARSNSSGGSIEGGDLNLGLWGNGSSCHQRLDSGDTLLLGIESRGHLHGLLMAEHGVTAHVPGSEHDLCVVLIMGK